MVMDRNAIQLKKMYCTATIDSDVRTFAERLGTAVAQMRGGEKYAQYALFIYLKDNNTSPSDFYEQFYEEYDLETEAMEDKKYSRRVTAELREYFNRRAVKRRRLALQKIGKDYATEIEHEDLAVLTFIKNEDITEILHVLFFLEGYNEEKI